MKIKRNWQSVIPLLLAILLIVRILPINGFAQNESPGGTILSLDSADVTVDVALGTEIADIPLPATLAAMLDDESTVDVPVTWDDGGNYNKDAAGTYTFTANLGDYLYDGTLPVAYVEVKEETSEETSAVEETSETNVEEETTLPEEETTLPDDSEEPTDATDPESDTVFVIEDSSGTKTGYSSLADAIKSINEKTGSYTFVFTSDYEVTSDDAEAIENNGSDAELLTFTGEYNNGEDTIINVLTINSDISWVASTDTTFKNINFGSGTGYIFGNGNKLTIDTGVSCDTDTPVIYGGGKESIAENTDVVIKSGSWDAVVAGNSEDDTTIDGNVKVTVSGDAVVTELYGAAAGTITGDVNVNVKDASKITALYGVNGSLAEVLGETTINVSGSAEVATLDAVKECKSVGTVTINLDGSEGATISDSISTSGTLFTFNIKDANLSDVEMVEGTAVETSNNALARATNSGATSRGVVTNGSVVNVDGVASMSSLPFGCTELNLASGAELTLTGTLFYGSMSSNTQPNLVFGSDSKLYLPRSTANASHSHTINNLIVNGPGAELYISSTDSKARINVKGAYNGSDTLYLDIINGVPKYDTVFLQFTNEYNVNQDNYTSDPGLSGFGNARQKVVGGNLCIVYDYIIPGYTHCVSNKTDVDTPIYVGHHMVNGAEESTDITNYYYERGDQLLTGQLYYKTPSAFDGQYHTYYNSSQYPDVSLTIRIYSPTGQTMDSDSNSPEYLKRYNTYVLIGADSEVGTYFRGYQTTSDGDGIRTLGLVFAIEDEGIFYWNLRVEHGSSTIHQSFEFFNSTNAEATVRVTAGGSVQYGDDPQTGASVNMHYLEGSRESSITYINPPSFPTMYMFVDPNSITLDRPASVRGDNGGELQSAIKGGKLLPAGMNTPFTYPDMAAQWQYTVPAGEKDGGSGGIRWGDEEEEDKIDLTISKAVSGQHADLSQPFTFTAYFQDASGKPLAAGTQLSYTGGVLDGSSATAPSAGTLTLDAEGKATFNLSAGQKIIISNVNATYKVRVVETAVTGYTTAIYDSVTNSTITSADTGVISLTTADRSFDFINTYVTINPTGIATSNSYLPILLAVVLAAIAMAVVVARKRYQIRSNKR